MLKRLLLIILVAFVKLHSQSLTVPIKFPTSLDGHEIVNGDTIIGVFLRDDTKNRTSLNELGINVSTEINGLMTGRVSLSNFRNINRNKSVQWMIPVGVLFTSLEQSSPMVNKHIGQQNAGVTGKNVIIGIYDTGIDFSSDDFKNSDNTTRILKIWDQSVSGNPPDPTLFNYGYEWNSSSINNGDCTQRDYNGHGTHVSGIASANGNNNTSVSDRYIGMAPDADN